MITKEITDSSHIKGVGYVAREQTLYLKFNNEAIYSYLNVPIETFRALIKAESKGQFFAKEIKGKFSFQREQ